VFGWERKKKPQYSELSKIRSVETSLPKSDCPI
jgi:hypothetical protein